MGMTGTVLWLENRIEALALTSTEDPEERASLDAQLSETISEYMQRVDDLGEWFARAEAEVEYLRKRKGELDELIDRWESKQKTVRRILAARLDETEQKTLKGRERSITLRKGSMQVDVYDSTLVPAKFVIVKESRSVDKRAIKAALDNFESVPGAELIEGPATVVIK